jgi:hypothetical protein
MPYRHKKRIELWKKEKIEQIAQGLKIPDLNQQYRADGKTQSLVCLNNVSRYRCAILQDIRKNQRVLRKQSCINISEWDNPLPSNLDRAISWFDGLGKYLCWNFYSLLCNNTCILD